jgi:hypothetical protein
MSTLNCKNIQYPAGTGTINVPAGTKLVSPTAGGIYSPGNVIQTIQGSLVGNATTTATSYVTTGLQVTITPTNIASKILIQCQLTGVGGSATGGGFAIYRNGSAIFTPGANDSNGPYMIYGGSIWQTSPLLYLDSPGSTSALTYTVYFRSYNGGAFYINQSSGGLVTNATSTIVVQEIGG